VKGMGGYSLTEVLTMSMSTSRTSMLIRFVGIHEFVFPPHLPAILAGVTNSAGLEICSLGAGVVYDFPLRGMRVSTEAPIKPGDHVSVLIRLPRQVAPAEITVATVQWTKDRPRVGFSAVVVLVHGRLRRYMTVLSKKVR